MDIVEQVKLRKAAEDAAHAAKLEAARKGVMEDAALRQAAADAVRAKESAHQAAVEQARQVQEERREKTLALVAWKKAGGTAAQFEDAWPEMWAAEVKQRVARRGAAEAGATEQFYRQIF